MHRKILSLALILVLASCGQDNRRPLKLNFDKNNITVSGISSGGYMAHQLHVAYSDQIVGAGIFAAGPYGCAQGELKVALEKCIGGADNQPLELLIDYANDADESNAIASLENLANDKVWVFHGQADDTVSRTKVDLLIKWYQNYKSEIKKTLKMQAGHGIPTEKFGVECKGSQSPFINDCGFDAAGELLGHLYSDLKPKSQAVPNHLLIIEQELYLSDSQENTLADQGFLYIPENCAMQADCSMHIVFHGCSQNYESVNDSFVKNAGYNEWAEANNIIVFYPQARSSLVPLNPKACWDWWGYTGTNYDKRGAPQLHHIMQMLDGISLD